MARDYHQILATLDLSADARLQRRETAAKLVAHLFSDLDQTGAYNQLVIVPDGGLHYVPFAALTDRQAPPFQWLNNITAIAHLPSASVLANLRRNAGADPTKTLASIADPIFDGSDSRLKQAAAAEPTADRPGEGPTMPEQGLTRLPATSMEADTIIQLLDEDSGIADKRGGQALRNWVLSGELANYRYVHFATHSVLDNRRPELSFLALSNYNDQGQAHDGFLMLRDIYNLDLNAQLVVLSGCETALGDQIRGEGLMSLSRAFMYAGGQAVVASLWRVPERSTATLMARFYQGLLRDKLPPAQALLQAQQSLQKHRRWKNPYYWAGFVYQGDWQAKGSVAHGKD